MVGVLHTFSFNYIKHCDYVISVSNHMKNKLIGLGFPKEKIFYLPNNMIKISNGSQHVKPVLHPILIIGMITRIEKTKGVDIFINKYIKAKKYPFFS